MSGHTQGPWVRGAPETTYGLATIKTADDAAVIAEVFYAEGCGTLAEAEGDFAHMLAAPALADDAEKLTALLAHIVECAHYASDTDTDAEVLKRIESEAREVAKSVGYDGNTVASVRAARGTP